MVGSSAPIHGLRLLLTLGALAFILLGTAPSSIHSPPLDPPSRIVFEEELVLGRSRSDVLFGRITGVDADAEGRIYVGDDFANQIYRFDKEGRALSPLGQSGRGPGEFEALGDVQIHDRTLYAFDHLLRRVSLFDLSDDGSVTTQLIPPLPSGSFPGRLYVSPNGHLYVGYSTGYSDDDTSLRPKMRTLVQVDPDGEPGATVLSEYPEFETFATRHQGEVHIAPLPFARRPLIAIGADEHLYYAWSGTPELDVRSANPPSTQTLSLSADPVRITDSDRKNALSSHTEPLRGLLGKALATTYPALHGLLVDDRNRVWIGIRSSRTHVTWQQLDANGTVQQEASLPVEVELHAIHGTRAYGSFVHPSDGPLVVRYRMVKL